MSLRPVVNDTDCRCCPLCLGDGSTGACSHGPDAGICVNCAITCNEASIRKLSTELAQAQQQSLRLLRLRSTQVAAARKPKGKA